MKEYSRVDLETDTKKLFSDTGKSLERKGFSVVIVNDIGKIRKLIDKIIPDDTLVGLDGSRTIDDLDIPIILKEKWNVIIDPYQKNLSLEIRGYLMDKLPSCDHYITSIDKLTMDGKVIFKNKNGFLTKSEINKPENIIAFADASNIVKNFEEAKKGLKTNKLTVLEVSPYGLKRGLIDNYGQMEEYHDFMTGEAEKQNTFTIVLLAEELVY
jgi:hypothetical protein